MSPILCGRYTQCVLAPQIKHKRLRPRPGLTSLGVPDRRNAAFPRSDCLSAPECYPSLAPGGCLLDKHLVGSDTNIYLAPQDVGFRVRALDLG
jgi:hypothetical protein